MSPETRQCQNCKAPFTIDASDFAFYEKIRVPPPTFCWLCRAQRRLAFRGETRLYKRKSDFSGKEILSMYAPEMPVKVYEKDVWLSDQWDPMEYGREIDFSKPFLSQIKELLSQVPLKNLNIVGNAPNSEYTNHITEPKNSYLVFNASHPEDCLYGNGINYSRDCVDISHISESESCYGSFWLTKCARTIFSSQCENSYDLAFCKDCVGCDHCFGCVGLRNKSYHIFNKPYSSKEEYERVVGEYDTSSYKNLERIKEEAQEFWRQFPNKFIIGLHNTNVSGNYIDHSKNVRNSFLVREGENLRYCQYVQELPGSKDCYDYSIWGDSNELIYECCACGIGTNRVKFCLFVQENVYDIEYSIACSSSSNLFGCIGLRKKQYCILNKQYTKDEYEKLVPKIVQHMNALPYADKKGKIYKYGEFFPIEFSPFAYNDAVAQEFFPFMKEQALAEGYNWRDPEERDYKVTFPSEQLPDRIQDVSDDITQEIIGCMHGGTCSEGCTKAFRIIPQELQFYRKFNLPLPRLCPSCRRSERLQQRTPFQLWKRNCMCSGTLSDNQVYKNTATHFHGSGPCPNEFETSYAPERPEIVYCEQCYQVEVV